MPRRPLLRRPIATSLVGALFLGVLSVGPAAAQTGPVQSVLPGGASISVDVTSPEDGQTVRDGKVTISGTAAVGAGEARGRTAMVTVLDVSGSSLFDGKCGGDQNADKKVDTILDCEIAAAKSLNAAAVSSGAVAEVGVVAFEHNGVAGDLRPQTGLQLLTAPDADLGGRRGSDVDEVLESAYNETFWVLVSAGLKKFTSRPAGQWPGGTNFSAGLQAACDTLAASSQPHQVIAFMSDGDANRGRPVRDVLPCAVREGIVIHTFAVGALSRCSADAQKLGSLQLIADETGGTCTDVTDVAALPDVLPDVASTRLERLTLSVDGRAPVDISASATTPLPADAPATAQFTHEVTGLGPGTHSLCVTAAGRDPGGEGAVTDCVTVGGNTPPLAVAGPDLTVDEGGVVTLDGSRSSDGDGDVLSYRWTPLTSAGAPVDLTAASSATPRFVAPDDGTYTFRLTVSDGQASATDDVAVTVRNVAPATTAQADASYADGVTLVTTGVNDAGWLDTHEVAVDWGDGTPRTPATVTAGAGWGTAFGSHVYADAGAYTVTVTATDDDGGSTVTTTTASVADPVALWAGSTTAPRTIDWSGGSGAVEGRVHTNGELRVRGATKTVTGPSSHVLGLSADTDRHVFRPAPVQGSVEEPPVRYDIADYRPGGRRAVEAGSAYRDLSARCASAGSWHVVDEPVPAGVYYSPCDVRLNGSAIGGEVTVVSEGTITVSGSRPAFEPYVDGLLFLSGSTADRAIDVSASSSKFLGYLHALRGQVQVSGSGNRFFCGLLGDRIALPAAEVSVRGSGCARPQRTLAATYLVPELELDLAGAPATAVPGDEVASTVRLRNGGAVLAFPGVVGAENVDTRPATLAHSTYAVERYSVPDRQWVVVAAHSATAPGHSPAVAPPAAEPLRLRATGNAVPGVTYPGQGDALVGTTIAPGSLASWGYQADVELTAPQVAALLDPAQTSAVRLQVRFELTPGDVQVRRLFRYADDVLPDLRKASADVRDVEVTVVPPVGDARVTTAGDDPALARLAPGGAAAVPVAYTVPVPRPRSAEETDAGYLNRLTAADGAVLATSAFARARSGVGLLVAGQRRTATTQHLPLVTLDKRGQSEVSPGGTARWDVDLRNAGAAAASAVAVTDHLDGVRLTGGAVGVLAPGERATATAELAVPATQPTGALDNRADVTWRDANGNAYGPVADVARATVRTGPRVGATLTAAVHADADGNGLPSAGDTLRYTATVTNRAGTELTGVAYRGTVPAHTALVAGSVTTSRGTVTTAAPVDVALGRLAAGEAATVTYDVRVETSATSGDSRLSATGTVTSDQLAAVPADDPAAGGAADPTVTRVVVATPRLEAALVDDLAVDRDGDGRAGPGDTLEYTLRVSSSGSARSTGVVVTTALHPALTLVDGSVRTSAGTVRPRADTGPGAALAVDLGVVDPLTDATIRFRAAVADPLAAGTDVVTVQGTVTSAELTPLVTDDPRTTEAADPTSTTVGARVPSSLPGPVVGGMSIGGAAARDGVTVTDPVEVRAAIAPLEGASVASWTVTYRAEGSTVDVPLASGTGAPAVTADGSAPLLATFDPTIVANGAYTLTVAATSSTGGVTTSSATVLVDSDFKPGRYTTTVEDLTVAMGGLPLRLQRSYDSFDKAPGDFGVGWNARLADFRVVTNGPLGAGGWSQAGGKCGLVFCSITYSTDRPHFVTVSWPDGRQETFDLTPNPGNTFFSVLTTAAFTGRPGTTSKLEAVDSGLASHNDGNLYQGPFGIDGIYDPQQFRLTAKDGSVYLLDRSRGLLSMTDRNGATLTVTDDGVTSSAGPALRFTRDTAGRITAVTGPDGERLAYRYDARGDLVGVTDAAGRETAYRYDAQHHLVGVEGPGGTALATMRYEGGRLVAITDASGATTAVRSDVGDRQEVVTDPTGRLTTVSTYDARGDLASVEEVFDGRSRVTRYRYDDAGRLVERIDPTGGSWTGAYDARGDLTSFTDPTGVGVTATYDAWGQPTSMSDTAGARATYSYDAAGRLVSATDPTGARETFAYDAAGNQVQRVDAHGGTWSWTYDATGRVTSSKDPVGAVRSSTYAGGRLASERDALGGTTTYRYDAAGNLTGRTAPDGSTTAYGYDAYDRLTASTDEAGHTTRWAYDAVGRTTGSTDPLGRTTGYAYDAAGRPTTVTDPAGAVTAHRYDGAGRLVAVVDPLGRVTRTAYDDADRPTSVTTPDGATTRTAYDAAGRVVATTDPLGQTSRRTYDAAGRLATLTDPLGRTERFSYDAAGRQVASVDGAGGRTAREYDGDRLVAVTDPAGATTRYVHDAAGRVVERVDPLGRRTVSAYDLSGRLVSTTDPAGGRTSSAHDALGRVVAETSPSGSVTGYGYDARGLPTSVTDAVGGVTRTAYDAAGQAVSVTDPRGSTTTSSYDAAGRLVQVTDALGGTVRFGYDAAGQRTSLTDPNGAVRRFEHDPAGRLVAESDPLGRTTRTAYDAAGRVASTTDPRGVATTRRYDAAGQLVSRTDPDGAVSFGYDTAGRRTTMADPTGVTTWRHDAVGRTTSVAAPAGTVSYGYDAAGQRTSMTLPGGRVVTYGYDAAGRATSLTAPGVGAVRTDYTADGRPATVTRPNGVTTTTTYDGVGRTTGVEHATAGSVLSRFTYTLDAAGNRTGVTGTRGTERYTFDGLGRLVAAAGPGGRAQSWSYDAAGNRLSETTDGATTAYRYDAAGQVAAVTAPGGAETPHRYDAAGNLLAAGSDSFTWDSRNRLTGATAGGTTARYGYDGADRRVSSTVDGTTRSLVWDRAGGLDTVVGDGTTTWLHADGAVLAATAGDATTWPLADALGSVRAATDAAGAVVGTADWTPFGARAAATGAVGAFGFTGAWSDPTGLVHLRARDYSPGLGRFLSADTVEQGAPGTGGFNRYAYVGGNPTTWTDPTGHAAATEYVVLTARTVPAAQLTAMTGVGFVLRMRLIILADKLRGAAGIAAGAATVGAGGCAVFCGGGEGADPAPDRPAPEPGPTPVPGPAPVPPPPGPGPDDEDDCTGYPDRAAYYAGLETQPNQRQGKVDGRYQAQVAGTTEYHIWGGGEAVWADGLVPAADTAVDAKYVGDVGSSPFVPGSSLPAPVRAKIYAKELWQFQRYGLVLNDTCVPPKALNVITNRAEAVPYFQQLLVASGTPGSVRVQPEQW